MADAFLRPRLRGARFDGNAIPLEVLKDLAVLEEMVAELAKWKFRQAHPDRKRSPRGFTEHIELRLAALEDGSAVPVIALFVASPHLPGVPPPNVEYYEQARDAIVCAIDAAEQDQPILEHLPEEALSYFDRLGRSLREGESIEFTTPSRAAPASLNSGTRRKLLLASSRVKEVTEEVVVRGTIPEADQDDRTFEVQLIDGRKVRAPIEDQHLDTILSAFNGYRGGLRVALQGIGKLDRQHKLLRLDSVEHINLLEALDVPARLDELRSLQDGWLDGGGRAPDGEGLDWLARRFDLDYPDELPLPHVYPTPEGHVQAEWSIGSSEVTLGIDLQTYRADWQRLDLDTDEAAARVLELDQESDWGWLASEIGRLAGGEHD